MTSHHHTLSLAHTKMKIDLFSAHRIESYTFELSRLTF